MHEDGNPVREWCRQQLTPAKGVAFPGREKSVALAAEESCIVADLRRLKRWRADSFRTSVAGAEFAPYRKPFSLTTPASWGWRVLSASASTCLIGPARRRAGSKSRTRTSRDVAG